MAKEGKKGFFKEFKEFAISGNMFDMAIAVIIGAQFKDVVGSFTDNVIMPIISMFTGGVDFSEWKIALPSLFTKAVEALPGDVEAATEAAADAADAAAAAENVNYLFYGNFISKVISFLILMLVVFLLVKGVNKLRKAAEARKAKEEEQKEEAPPEPTAEEKLLIEIRDLLAEKK